MLLYLAWLLGLAIYTSNDIRDMGVFSAHCLAALTPKHFQEC